MKNNIHRLRHTDTIHTLDESKDDKRSAAATAASSSIRCTSGTIKADDPLIDQIRDTATVKDASAIQHV
jgi:hypothetical protein